MRNITTKKPTNNRRKSDVWLTRVIAVGMFLVAAVITGAVTWVVKTDVIEKVTSTVRSETRRLTMNAGLALNEVLVQGRMRTNPNALLEAMDVERGMPILAIDIHEARKKIEKLPWIRSARVERYLPDALHLWIEERKPIAIWQKNGKFMAVDKDGIVIDSSIKGLEKLPIVVGDDAPEHTSDLLAMLETQPALKKRVKAAVRIGERRWDIMLDNMKNGILVHLPEENLEQAWSRLENLDETHDLLKRNLSMIDLRMPDRLIVRLNSSGDNYTKGQDA
ncbi:MAG: cell division protein FtsQ/DivIB [Alphaproteobacteria bacterium]|nr:cell division protein FtsQ/DivIB [Alphaproteobacteria bacterium]